MPPEVFSAADGPDAQERFQRWQAAHPTGFYLNRRSATRGVLHKVGCKHVGGAWVWDPVDGDVARNAKVCHPDAAELTRWAAGEGVTVAPCEDCLP